MVIPLWFLIFPQHAICLRFLLEKDVQASVHLAIPASFFRIGIELLQQRVHDFVEGRAVRGSAV
jgi:hypothetical protein